jgi:hypothetical protein
MKSKSFLKSFLFFVLSFSTYFALEVSSSVSSQSQLCESPIRVTSTGILVDACGRARIFRGVNSVEKSIPYLDERLTDADALMWQSLGLNVIRLGIMWSGVYPTKRNVPNETLLSLYAETSARLFSIAGIYSFLDAHQDGFSPAFCDDGAPPWVAQMCSMNTPSFPMPLAPAIPIDNTTFLPINCSLVSNIAWAELYFTSAVGQCFQQLYTNSTDTFASFSEFFEAIIAAYANSSNKGTSILAYELLNEPWAGNALENPLLMIPGVADAINLAPFYGNLSYRIRAAEFLNNLSSKIIAMEPVTWDDIGPSGFSFNSTSWPNSGLEMLSYHYYTLPDIQGSEEQVRLRAMDALRLGASAMLTEYDLGLVNPVNAPYSKLDMRKTLNACDSFRHGWIGWDYSCVYQGGNGTTMHVETLRELARPVPLALAGSGNASWFFNASDEMSPFFQLVYSHEDVVSQKGGNTSIFISTGLWFDYSTLDISVESDPPGAVIDSLIRYPGYISLPSMNETQIPGPVTFDYCLLSIGSNTLSSISVVTVTVKSHSTSFSSSSSSSSSPTPTFINSVSHVNNLKSKDPPGVIVFANASDNYHTFRIPTVALTNLETILVFAEGRARNNLTTVDDDDCFGVGASAADWKCTNKDIVLKRSLDQGTTWSELIVLTQANTSVFYTNPQPLAMMSSNTVFVLYMQCISPQNGGNAFINCTTQLQKSLDDGISWSDAIAIPPVQTSSGGFGGIELSTGRLIFSPPGSSKTGALISDTKGETWRWGQPALNGSGENQIADLSSTELLMTVRKTNNTRMLFKSFNGGDTWEKGEKQNVTDPNCQASMISIGVKSRRWNNWNKKVREDENEQVSTSRLLFSNPHTSGLLPYAEGRQNVTVQWSTDTKVWTPYFLVDQGPSAYTALIQLNDTLCGICYEESHDLPVDFRSIRFVKFNC